jgi:hypothetical protein
MPLWFPLAGTPTLDQDTTDRCGGLVAETVQRHQHQSGVSDCHAREIRKARYGCNAIGSYARPQELLRQGHTELDSNTDGEASD